MAQLLSGVGQDLYTTQNILRRIHTVQKPAKMIESGRTPAPSHVLPDRSSEDCKSPLNQPNPRWGLGRRAGLEISSERRDMAGRKAYARRIPISGWERYQVSKACCFGASLHCIFWVTTFFICVAG